MVTADQTNELLRLAQTGDEEARNELIALVYEELRIMAHRQLRGESSALTLSTTALINEAYVKLVDSRQAPFKGAAYFFGAAARAMRQVVIDLARIRNTRKHGAGHQRIMLDVDELAVDECASELLELDEALNNLSLLDERLSRVVECRFFGGLTDEQTSDVIGVNARTVRRDWRKARAWLYKELHGSAPLATESHSP